MFPNTFMTTIAHLTAEHASVVYACLYVFFLRPHLPPVATFIAQPLQKAWQLQGMHSYSTSRCLHARHASLTSVLAVVEQRTARPVTAYKSEGTTSVNGKSQQAGFRQKASRPEGQASPFTLYRAHDKDSSDIVAKK